ncbi:pyridine nucleotide-disulfide oxidoreductase [Streptomyces sp. NPDC086182]|uniref:NAD(P)/FAD-dependent oxidoreductase n=1 Tax=Streptomyces sp. NPDC086182 TaxID=3155058 RepID=UPI0034218870
MRTAVIVGGGMAGMLAAQAVSGFVDEAVIIEPDDLPDTPAPRTGLPQARHIHILMAGGADAANLLIPGIVDDWTDAGAHRHTLTTDMVALSPEGWYRRWKPSHHFLMTASRDLLDWVVRNRVLKNTTVRLLPGRKVTGLLGTDRQITGVRHAPARGRDSSQSPELLADIVIDASGRASRATAWLDELGISGIPERSLDTGLTYATRIFRAPEGAERIPVFNVMADPRAGNGQSAALAPIESGLWIASLAGIKGHGPSRDPDAFVPFALGLRHPLIGQLLHDVEAVSDVAVNHSSRNRRYYFEKARVWPDGFVALGDSVVTYNPVYGQGMSVAARGALALQAEVERAGDVRAPGLARRIQRAAARPAQAAWALAMAQDIHYTSAHGQTPSWTDRLASAFSSRLSRTATGSAFMASAVTDVTTMRKNATRLMRPDVIGAALLGPLLDPLTGPQLTERESRLVSPVSPVTGASGPFAPGSLQDGRGPILRP